MLKYVIGMSINFNVELFAWFHPNVNMIGFSGMMTQRVLNNEEKNYKTSPVKTACLDGLLTKKWTMQ